MVRCISFVDGTLTVSRTRVLVDAKVIEKCPKSKRGHRTLPLFPAVTAALEALYKTQLAERAAAGAAYAGDVDSGYVCADELGAPLHPERYSDEFGRLCAEAGLPKCRSARLQALGQLAAGEAGRAGLGPRPVVRPHGGGQHGRLHARQRGRPRRDQ